MAVDPLDIAKKLTIQDRNNNLVLSYPTSFGRNPLLPDWGTKARDQALFELSHNPFNTMFVSVMSGLVKKIQSTPFVVKAGDEWGDYWQQLLAEADLGNGWSAFIGRVVMDFLRYDSGAFIEVIAGGDPNKPINSPIVGLANLDPLRCWFTGDSEYPVLYWAEGGGMHRLHHTRVYQLVDMPDSAQYRRGFGLCALSRAIAPVYQEIYIQQYMVQLFDDNPPPGFVLFGNISKQEAQAIVQQYRETRQTDSGGVFGRVIPLYGLDSEFKPTIEFINFSAPPDKFDYEQTINTLARQMANAIGIDLNEFWELTGRNIGSSTQAEIMAQKSKGKFIGFILRELERFINNLLPDGCSFEFAIRDETEENSKADIASKWMNVVTMAGELLSVGEKRILLIQNVESIRDVLTDEEGNVVTLPNPVPSTGQGENEVMLEDDYIGNNNPDAVTLDDVDKALLQTIGAFATRMVNLVRGALGNVASLIVTKLGLQSNIAQQGTQAYIDGKIAGGEKMPVTLSDEDELALSQWRAEQNDYIKSLMDDIKSGKVNTSELEGRVPLWVNKSLKKAYHLGLASTNNKQFYMWVLGNTIEHCTTCLTAHGQVHRLGTWVKAGILPQSNDLECGGWRCDCRLIPTDVLFAKGNLEAVRRTMKKHVHVHRHGVREHSEHEHRHEH